MRTCGTTAKTFLWTLSVSSAVYIAVVYYLKMEYIAKNTQPCPVRTRSIVVGSESANYSSDVKSLISEIAKSLHSANKHVRGTKTSDHLKSAISLMDDVLLSLNISKHELVGRKTLPAAKSVCPEKFMGPKFGYHLFYHGFEVTNCSYARPLSELVTIVVYIKDSVKDAVSNRTRRFLNSVAEVSNITVHIATSSKLEIAGDFPKSVSWLSLDAPKSDGQVWNRLVKQVTTPYVFVARNAEVFTEDARLERLVREIEMLQVPVAAGAVRYPDGHWKKGCYQSVHRNFTLRYLEGYDESLHDCLFCDYSVGPFLAKTETLKSIQFSDLEMDAGLFEDWYLRLTKKNLETIVCPDSMFHSRFIKTDLTWQPFLALWGLYKYITPQERIIISDCKDNGKNTASRALSPCRISSNTEAVKLVMNICETSHIYCQPHEGSMLGPVKFEKVLPWEWDADILVLSHNRSALDKLVDYFKSKHFHVIESNNIALILGYSVWAVELYEADTLDCEKLTAAGFEPTRVFVDGDWVWGPRNPGMASRNRYGPEIYQHAAHWRNTGHKSGWDAYETNVFPKCDIPGDHACLERYNADGNIAFTDPLP